MRILYVAWQDSKTRQWHTVSHGIRCLPEPAVKRVDTLCPGEQLFLMPDPQNPLDAHALALRTTAPVTLVGYCPRYFNRDWLVLLRDDPVNTGVIVERVNHDAPMQLRLLCRITAPWPEHFQPCVDEEYEALA